MAFLLGTRSGAKVCRYERFVREPSLETALAYEAIFQKPARELFAGLFQKVEKQVTERAKALTFKVEHRANRQADHKREALTKMADLFVKKSSEI